MFWGCFSYVGMKSLILIEGMVNSQKYMELLERKLSRELEKLDGNGNAIFQQDSAPCRTTSKIMKKYFKDNNKTCLDIPGNSSYLYPIKNLSAIYKSRLHKPK